MMTDTNFPPGPWKLAEDGSPFVYSLNEFGSNGFWCVPQSGGKGRAEDQELMAIAHLIRSAPDTYKALQEMCDMWTTVCDAQGWEPEHMAEYTNAVNSMAKARGESHE